MKDNITVQSASGSYEVVTGQNILTGELTSYFKDKDTTTCFVFADENAWKYHSERVRSALKAAGQNFELLQIPQGEASKSVEWWKKGLDFLLEKGVHRNAHLIAVGGGITGDLAGFIASSALRGIPLVHIPTTLLAMVDSSIGGKTGINHETGKNLIGSFYAPQRVISEIDFLQTLPAKEWINGLSEILKYGAIADNSIFDEAEFFLSKKFTTEDPDTLIKLITKCAGIKARIVRQDEFEGGKRAWLNFGHTFAHALEKAYDFNKISHGEAVFLGMLAAIELSNLSGSKLNPGKIERFRDLYSFNINKDNLNVIKLIHFMQSDKKRTENHLRFVLLKEWQQPSVVTVTSDEAVKTAWNKIAHYL